MLGRPGGGSTRGSTGALGIGIQLPRYRQHYVPRDQIHGRPQRARTARVHQGNWIHAYACAGGRADARTVERVRGEAVQGEYEAWVIGHSLNFFGGLFRRVSKTKSYLCQGKKKQPPLDIHSTYLPTYLPSGYQ